MLITGGKKENKKPNATNCSDHNAINFITHIAKIVASKHRRRIERKIEDVLAEYQFGFSRGKGKRGVILILRKIWKWFRAY